MPILCHGSHLNGMVMRIVKGQSALQDRTTLCKRQGCPNIQQVWFNVHMWRVAVGAAICDVQHHLVVVMVISMPWSEDHLQQFGLLLKSAGLCMCHLRMAWILGPYVEVAFILNRPFRLCCSFRAITCYQIGTQGYNFV